MGRQRREISTRARLVILLLGIVVGLDAGVQAHAGYNPFCDMAVQEHHPADGEMHVVRNTIVLDADAWCLPNECYDASITVLDASQNPVPFFAAPLAAQGCVPVFFGAELLVANAEYCVVETGSCFFTGTETDEEPPDFVLGKDERGDGLDVSWFGSPDIVLITMGVGSWGVGMDPENPLVHFTDSNDHGDTITITAWDRAGNSTTDSVHLRGCQSGTGNASPGFFILLLCLIGLRAWPACRGRS